MFVENGHKRTFLEVLVKDYNTNQKQSQSPRHQQKQNPVDT